MYDNVRLAQKSLTKKISFEQRNTKPYHTIQSLQSQPTKKKITISPHQQSKKQHALHHTTTHLQHHIENHKKQNNYQNQHRRLSESNNKKSIISNRNESYHLDGSINRNLQGFKLGILREGRQKYKRSEHVRSMIESKKMSSLKKLSRQEEVKSQKGENQEERFVSTKSVFQFQDLQLDEIINPKEDCPSESNLEEVFQQASLLYCTYLNQKTSLLAHQQTASLSLTKAYDKFTAILNEIGQLSTKNLFMLALIHFEFSKYNDVIMYMTKILTKTKGNLFLLNLINPQHQKNTALSTKVYNLNLIGYLYLAQSYKITKNFLSAINLLSKCQEHLKSVLSDGKRVDSLRENEEKEEGRDIGGRGKKKSYIFSVMQGEDTLSKMKRAFATNSNVQLNYQKNLRENLRTMEGQKEIKLKKSLQLAKSKQSYMLDSAKTYQRELTTFYLLLARLHLQIKNYDHSISYYRRSLLIQPLKIEPMLELGCVYHVRQGSDKCLGWLEECLSLLRKEQRGETFQLDQSYLLYHKALVLLGEMSYEQSYQLLNVIKIRQLQSQVHFYKGFIKLQHLKSRPSTQSQRITQIESLFMNFNQSISAFTSKTYLIKSYFYKLLILLFEKKDYYGAQYELNRFNKIVPLKPPPKSIPLPSQHEDWPLLEDSSESENQFKILGQLVEGVVCVLKMKIVRGLGILKQVGVRVQGCEWMMKSFGLYYQEIIKVIYQFKFYSYYILREYQLSLKHCNKLKQTTTAAIQLQVKKGNDNSHIKGELQIININQLMLECIILIKQSKFNYALSKLQEIDSILNHNQEQVLSLTNGKRDSKPIQKHGESISNGFIVNNLSMLKALCYINLYSQIQEQGEGQNRSIQDNGDDNKEILLSAQELLRHCLITDKENSLIYYLISAIHYELNQYDSSLKYIREALQFSDDHMIKHYFCKANTKFMLSRYDQAIKDYTNAVIVFKEQAKVQGKSGRQDMKKDNPDVQQQYFSEKQVMFIDIYLNRAITYIKYCYQLTTHRNYSQNANLIINYKMKAGEDLIKYFQEVKIAQKVYNSVKLKEALLLLMHTDDPAQIIEINKELAPKYNLLTQYDIIKVYYQIKELNNCIQLLTTYITQQQNTHTNKKEKPFKSKKSMEETIAKQQLRIRKLSLDLKCLQALKKSSRRIKGATEEALISLLEMTEEIYHAREQQMGGMGEGEISPLQQLFGESCGQIFRWSDILFFIGVIHYELEEYQTAIKYFQESYNEKKSSGTLYTLDKFINPVLKKASSMQESQEEYLFFDLESIFQNRIYSKEELEYNIGICYLMLNKYKQAYYYLQDYPKFITIIKQAISNQENHVQNEFMDVSRHSEDMSKKSHDNKRISKKGTFQNQRDLDNKSYSEQQMSQREQDDPYDQYQNITPFPTHNRLCSIYSPKTIAKYKFFLSFCLPKIQLPAFKMFSPEEIQPGQLCETEGDESQRGSVSSRANDLNQEQYIAHLSKKGSIQSAIKHISLTDLQMKPIAPWIRQSSAGVIFTENVMNYSIQLNSERQSRRKEDKQQGKSGKQRYGQYQLKK